MADVTIGAKLSVDASQATTSVKNFKQELALANAQVVEMTQKFGATSQQASEAAKKAAQLKDAVGDAKSLVDAFNPDTKFRAFGAAINTVVGGFTALTGALGLVGVESKEVQNALLKVQSALALSQGISQLQEGIQTFKNLNAVIQQSAIFQKANAVATSLAAGAMRLLGISTTTTSTAMNVLKGAIIATGIGALIILLGTVANAMGLFGEETEDTAKSQEALEKATEKTNEALQKQLAFLGNEEKLAVARAKNRGATENEIFQIEQDFRRKRFNETLKAYDAISTTDKKQGEKLLQQLKDFNAEGQAAELNHQTRLREIREEEAKKELERLKKLREQQLKEAEADLNRQAANFTATGGPGAGLNIGIPKSQAQLQIEQEAQARHELRETTEAINERLAENDAKFTEIHKRNVDERMAADAAEFQAKEAIANASISILGSLAELVGKQTAAGKVLAIAEIAAGTAKGFIQALDIAQKSAAGTGPAAAFAFPVFYATQIAAVLAAVTRAKSVLGSAGGGTVTGPGLSTPPPLQPQRPTTQTTQLDQQSLNAIGNATSRAYVLETDVTNNQERVRRLNRAARLGG